MTRLELIDRRIELLRRHYHRARKRREFDKADEHISELDLLQRERFASYGRFKPCADGKLYYYDCEYERLMNFIPVMQNATIG